MFSLCSCEAGPLRHPVSIVIYLLVPKHHSRPDGHASSRTHGRHKSLGAILKDDHHLVQTILNALVSRSLSEYVQLPLLEDEVEEAR